MPGLHQYDIPVRIVALVVSVSDLLRWNTRNPTKADQILSFQPARRPPAQRGPSRFTNTHTAQTAPHQHAAGPAPRFRPDGPVPRFATGPFRSPYVRLPDACNHRRRIAAGRRLQRACADTLTTTSPIAPTFRSASRARDKRSRHAGQRIDGLGHAGSRAAPASPTRYVQPQLRQLANDKPDEETGDRSSFHRPRVLASPIRAASFHLTRRLSRLFLRVLVFDKDSRCRPHPMRHARLRQSLPWS